MEFIFDRRYSPMFLLVLPTGSSLTFILRNVQTRCLKCVCTEFWRKHLYENHDFANVRTLILLHSNYASFVILLLLFFYIIPGSIYMYYEFVVIFFHPCFVSFSWNRILVIYFFLPSCTTFSLMTEIYKSKNLLQTWFFLRVVLYFFLNSICLSVSSASFAWNISFPNCVSQRQDNSLAKFLFFYFFFLDSVFYYFINVYVCKNTFIYNVKKANVELNSKRICYFVRWRLVPFLFIIWFFWLIFSWFSFVALQRTFQAKCIRCDFLVSHFLVRFVQNFLLEKRK